MSVGQTLRADEIPLPYFGERQRAEIQTGQRRFALTEIGELKLGISHDEATRIYRGG